MPSEKDAAYAWRREAPIARAAVRTAYAWSSSTLGFWAALLAAAPFVAAAAFSPALLSLRPTAEMLAPIAAARAVADGAQSLAKVADPLQALLLMAGDAVADQPGRVHLAAKAIAAAALALAFAAGAAVRFPVGLSIALAAALAGLAAAPYGGRGEIALAALFVVATLLLAAPAEGHRRRARWEGGLAGALIFVLWLSDPAVWLAGLVALSATPFVSDRSGVTRYAFALGAALLLAAVAEALAPGLALSRAHDLSALFSTGIPARPVAIAGAAGAAGAVIAAAAIFGGVAHARGWATALGLAAVATAAGSALGVDPATLFVLAAAIAGLSVASPFYDGVFEAHDRASIAASGLVAVLTLVPAASLAWRAAGDFALQARVTASAPSGVRAAFALVQPQGPEVAHWIEEGRFSTPEARAFFSLSPADQSEAFLSAAKSARALADKGLNVAILTASDAACVLVRARACHGDGLSAARAAEVVFVPRLDLDPATVAARGQSEALLYTRFILAAETPFWDVWVRRGAALPAGVVVGAREFSAPPTR